MNKKVSSLLTTAILSGLLASQSVMAENEKTEATKDDQKMMMKHGKEMKNHQKMMKKEHNKAMKMKDKKMMDKNSCKNGCGGQMQSEEKKDDSQTEDKK